MNLKIACAILALCAGSAQAEFIDTDWKSAGDGKATLDKDTGIEWLKFENTANMTYSELQAEMATGGQFDGWRLPTTSELQNLMLSVTQNNALIANIGAPDYRVSISYNSTWAADWRDVMGRSYYQPYVSAYSYGVSLDDNGDFVMFGVRRLHSNTTQDAFVNWTRAANYTDNDTFSYFLVSDGGDTLSSINDPTLNVNNPNSPVQQVPISLAPGFLGLLWLSRRKSAMTIDPVSVD